MTDQQDGELAGAILVASERLLRAIGELERSSGAQSSSGTSTVTINAGGIGVWLAVTACIVTVTVSIVIGIIGTIIVTNAHNQLRQETRELREKDDVLLAYISNLTKESQK